MDAYANDSGFPLRAADQLRFNRFLARAAHARGLSIGLKNDLDQVKALEPAFDWALNEQCFQYEECERLRPFTAAGRRCSWPSTSSRRARSARGPCRGADGDAQAAGARRGARAVLVSVTDASAAVCGSSIPWGATRAVGSPSRVARWTVATWHRPAASARLRR